MIDFHSLKIWQRSVALAVGVANASKGRGRLGPRGLVSQLTRSSSAVHANIAEAAGQSTPLQTARGLDVALGELNECESHLTVAAATTVLRPREAQEFIREVQELRRMTLAFKRWVLRNEV